LDPLEAHLFQLQQVLFGAGHGRGSHVQPSVDKLCLVSVSGAPVIATWGGAAEAIVDVYL
jgi:hypothetical protein